VALDYGIFAALSDMPGRFVGNIRDAPAHQLSWAEFKVEFSMNHSLILTAAVLHALWNLLAKRAKGKAPFIWLMYVASIQCF